MAQGGRINNIETFKNQMIKIRIYTIFFLILILSAFIRVYNVWNNPPGLSWDEASLGYNAFTIGQSLRDEHGEFLPLNRFIAFGDYKPPGYIYTAVPFVKIFGLNELTVKMPSILGGILIVLFTFLLTRELFASRILPLL